MAKLEASCLNASRLVLYGLHWLSSLCIFSITAAVLIGKSSIFGVSFTWCCWSRVGMCRVVIAWGVVGWLGTFALVASFVIGALGIWELPLIAEMGIWVEWTVYWTVGAVASVVATRAFDYAEGYVVVLLLWLLIPISITSSISCCSARCCGKRSNVTGGAGGERRGRLQGRGGRPARDDGCEPASDNHHLAGYGCSPGSRVAHGRVGRREPRGVTSVKGGGTAKAMEPSGNFKHLPQHLYPMYSTDYRVAATPVRSSADRSLCPSWRTHFIIARCSPSLDCSRHPPRGSRWHARRPRCCSRQKYFTALASACAAPCLLSTLDVCLMTTKSL